MTLNGSAMMRDELVMVELCWDTPALAEVRYSTLALELEHVITKYRNSFIGFVGSCCHYSRSTHCHTTKPRLKCKRNYASLFSATIIGLLCFFENKLGSGIDHRDAQLNEYHFREA